MSHAEFFKMAGCPKLRSTQGQICFLLPRRIWALCLPAMQHALFVELFSSTSSAVLQNQHSKLVCFFLFTLVAVIIALLNSINLSFNFCRGFASSSANPTASAGKEKKRNHGCCKNPHDKFHPKLRVVLKESLVYCAAVQSGAFLINKGMQTCKQGSKCKLRP